MKRINFLIAMSIMMFLATTTIIILSLCVIPVTGGTLMMVSMISELGYLGSYTYYSLYKQSK
jgi:uncharacterized Tic20 family protein